MRNRFFFIILGSLIFSAVAINLVQVYFFKNQRLKLIDHQISDSSSTLLNSKEFRANASDPKKIDDIITRVLGGARIGKLFVVRDPKNNIIYQTFNVGLVQAELPTSPEWIAVETPSEYVRIRNISIPGEPNIILQVGLVLDRNFINWKIVDTRVVLYFVGIIFTLFLITVFLTIVLLSPLRLLISHLNLATSNLVNLKDVEPLPLPLVKYTHGFWAKSDEFSGLINTVQKLIDRINLNYKLTRSWTLQMAHELKTPLAIIKAEAEAKLKSQEISSDYARELHKEVDHMSAIINEFLDWAELESSRPNRDLHALRTKNAISNVVARLEKLNPRRIQVDLVNDFVVFASPTHLDQLITNLITNSLKFSDQQSNVLVFLKDNSLHIKDRGPGIPEGVLEKLGAPFNIGKKAGGATGNGLGLAWVATICRLYGWNLKIQSNSAGTEVIVQFPDESY